MKTTSTLGLTGLALFCSLSDAQAQPWVTYDAALGTLPEAQCWEFRRDLAPEAAFPLNLAAGELHLSTTGLAATGVAGGAVYWERTDIGFNFNNDFSVEIRVRIVAAPNRSINQAIGWPRPGFALAVNDTDGRVFWIGLGTSEIFLSNTFFGQYGSANTVTLAFDTTDAPHTYRIERAAGGVGATLHIDGIPRLTLASLGPVEGSGGLIYFGDPTYWANSESYTSFVRFSGLGANGPITGISGPDPVVACPGQSATFTVTPSGPGPFSFQWRRFGVPIGVTTNPSAATPILTIPGVLTTDAGGYDCIITNACGSVTSNPAVLSIVPCGCSLADVAGGGTAGLSPDGIIDGSDFIAFVNSFSVGDPAVDALADVAGGGADGLSPDGIVDGSDFIAFINAFSAGC